MALVVIKTLDAGTIDTAGKVLSKLFWVCEVAGMMAEKNVKD